MRLFIAGLVVAIALVLVFLPDVVAWAERLEKRMPAWLQPPPDPVTWIQHVCWTVVGGLMLGLWAWITIAAFGLGFAIGATVMLGWFVWREVGDFRRDWGTPHPWWRGYPQYTGWLVDGIADVFFPLLVVVIAWTVAL